MSNSQDEPKASGASDEAVLDSISEHSLTPRASDHRDPWTPLMHAVETDDYEAVVSILKTSPDLEYEAFGETALTQACDRSIVLALLSAGADICRISHIGRRALVNLPPHPSDTALSAVTPEQFLSGCTQRFGTTNPERLSIPFWDAMIQAGVNAWEAGKHFKERGVKRNFGDPTWCAERFGQSITLMPDGRVIQIAGEHEDYYDPDFYIYNDVFEHHPDGSFIVYSYPENVFPPTDSHSATLMGGYIYIIGSLGYAMTRRYDHTPVYRLNTKTFVMEEVVVAGEAPGWIHKHAAVAISGRGICVSGGLVLTRDNVKGRKNEEDYILDIVDSTWKRKEIGAQQ